MIKSAHLTGPVSRKAGGLLDAVARLAQWQNQNQTQVKVFGFWDEFAESDRKSWNPVPVETFPPAWPKGIGKSARFLEELTAFAPDISHTHGLWLYPSIAVKNYSRQKNRPYLISPHGMLDPWAMKNSRGKKMVAWWLFERAHLHGARCLRALCASEAESMRQLNLPNPIAVIPNGIDLPSGSPTVTPPWQKAVEPGKKVLLFLSRIHPKKGLINLLNAWAQLKTAKKKEPEWILAIAGWDQGGHEAELKRLATELGLVWRDIRENTVNSIAAINASVLFLGPQFNAAKAACYHFCDAFVLPSFSEGLPMVILEAWAHSKPVVMTPQCNLPEGLQARAAIQVEATQSGVFAGLQELHDMTDVDCLAMGERARALVVARFTWSQVGQQLQTVHDWILGGGANPACLWRG